MRDEEEQRQKDLEAQKLREWEEKFDLEQKRREEEERLKEAKILLREKDRVTRKFNLVENKDYQEDYSSKLGELEVKRSKEN